MIQIPKEKAVAFLDKTFFRIYSPKLGKIVSAQFPSNVILDIELIDDEMFEVFMKAFIDQHKIPPLQLSLVLSPEVIFEKKLLAQGVIPRADEIQRFNEAVPFNEVASKEYTTDGITYVAATNNELINAFKGFFKKAGWYVTSVFPLSVLGKPHSAKQDIDDEAVQYIMKRFDDMRQFDMSDMDDTAPVSYFRLDTSPNNQQSKKTLPVLISVFAVLVGVLGFLMYSQQNAQVPVNAKLAPTTALVPTASAEANLLSPTENTGSSSATPVRSSLNIHIINSTGVRQSEDAAQQQLRASGYTSISVSQGQIVNGRPLVLFMKSVPAAERTPIIQALDRVLGVISVQETEIASYEATITLTKP